MQRPRRLALWLALGVVLYVAFAGLGAAEREGGRGAIGPGAAALVLLPLALLAGWARLGPARAGVDRIDPMARAGARATLAGACVLGASWIGPATLTSTAAGNLGAGLAVLGGLTALARMAGPGGLVTPAPASTRLDTAALASLAWVIAVVLPAWGAAAPDRAPEPRLVDYVTTLAGLGSLGLLLVAAARARTLRRLELGVGDRAWAALCLIATALAIGVAAAALGIAAAPRLLPVTSTVAALTACLCVTAADPTGVSRALRTTLAIALLAAPPALLAAWAARRGSGASTGAVVFVACAAAAVAGLAAPLVARLFAPQAARWLRAFEAATAAAMNPDPDSALEAALSRLSDVAAAAPWGVARGRRSRRRIATGAPAPGARDLDVPALYRLAPPERVCVDRAGYVQTSGAEVPPRLVELCDDEPERILRTDAVADVVVRRPDVRPVVAWLEQRDIAAAALVRDEAGPVGLLTIPSGGRRATMMLEEARALRRLADRLGAILSVSSMLARSHRRETDAVAELASLAERARDQERALERKTSRIEALARAIERPARVATYSAAARTTVELLEREAKTARPVMLLAAPGIDALAWAALVHLASPRRDGVLVVVDGTDGNEHDLGRWRDEVTSPLSLAKDGTLVVLDIHVLPDTVQSYVAAALGDDVLLVATAPATPDSLAATGRMNERLADRLGDRAVALPSLASRGEDVRPLALERLGRLGMRLRGRPLGLDAPALARLLDHDWPGNDAELDGVLVRAALASRGDVVGLAELDTAGFQPRSAPPTPTVRPASTAPRRRR